ncbi:hypothetical protein [Roseixanthobacter pseudopolyaromaticivorans]|uniref:hypothetical protein n=1 Tax=Xanthobacteraceae TaxID=335928 RepID=UPI00372999DA
MSARARILLAGASLLCLLSAPAAALDPWADTRAPGEQAAPNWPKKLPVQGARPDPQAAPAATGSAATTGAAPIAAAPPPQARPALSSNIPLPLAAPSEIRRAGIAPPRDTTPHVTAALPPLAPAAAAQAGPSAPAATPMDRVAAEALVRALPGAALPLLPPPSVSSPYAPTPNLQQAANRAPFATLAAGADAIVEEASQPDRAVSGPATNPPDQTTPERVPEVTAPAAAPQSAQAPAAEPVAAAPEQPHEPAGQVAHTETTPAPSDHANAEPTTEGHRDVAHSGAEPQGEAPHAGVPQGQAHEVPSKNDAHSPAPAEAASHLPAEKDAHGGDHKADGKTPAPPIKALVVAPPPAMANGISPMEAVRALQRLQDKVAAGSVEAVEGQRRMLAQIDQDFKAAAPTVWQDPRNARALVIHVLSGGNPAVLRGILAQEPLPALDERLLRGALAYVEGREEQALRLFGEIDARTLPNALGAQVAIAQAATTVRKDPAKAARLLDLARLLMPGTLIEEAALRRQILVASQSDDPDQFGRLSRQYLDRFAHSVYAGNFRQRFAAALTRMPFIDAPDGFQRLDNLLQPLDQASRREIFLLVARSAVIQGKAKTTITAAERALASAPPLSSDAERARLYKAAALAATHEGFQQAQIELAALDRDRLAPPDATLLDAALVAADLVRTAPNVADAPPGSAPKTSDSPPARAAPAQGTSPGAGGTPPAIASSAAAAPQSQAPQNAASEMARAPVPASPAKPPQPGAPQAPVTQTTAQADPAPSAIEEQARGTLAKIDKLLKEAPR